MLGVYERPNFIALDSLTGKIPENAVLILGARSANLRHQFEHCVKRHTAHAGCGAKRITLYESGYNTSSLFFV